MSPAEPVDRSQCILFIVSDKTGPVHPCASGERKTGSNKTQPNTNCLPGYCSRADQINFEAYSFANGTRLEQILELNRDAVIQDLSSQKTGTFMKMAINPEKKIRAWDCCAGSGGKAILLADLYTGLHLTVSDIRKSILENLRLRFVEAGISQYHAFHADLTIGK